MHHSCEHDMHAYCADIGVNIDMTSNLSFTCGVLEIVAGCLYCQRRHNSQQQTLQLIFSRFQHQQFYFPVYTASEMHFK